MPENNKKLHKILQKYDGVITGPNDLTGGEMPSSLFYFLANHLSYLLDPNPEKVISAKGVARRRKLNGVIKTLGVHFLANPQVFENRNFLKEPHAADTAPDPGIVLPKEPVIWCANHAFKDDTLATVLAAQRHAYILFGSVPQFYNTFDGVTAWLNGVIMTNRKVAISKQTSVSKAVRAMQFGADLMVFPEGVWNKSPNALLLDFWPGIYRIACETGAKVVPVVHYIRDCATPGKAIPIHTVIDDPIRIDDLSERSALELIRDVLATWFYLMMEVYGKTTREDVLAGYNTPTEAWEQSLEARVNTTGRYDVEIELCADYRPKWKTEPQQAWKAIADVTNITPQNVGHILYAKQLVAQCAREDFQHII